MKLNKIIWDIVRICLVITSILVFTPLIIPPGKSTPELFGLPYTLWVGILVYIIFITLIIIGISVHSKLYREDRND